MKDRTSATSRFRRKRGGYQVDLTELHALCEANYHRILRLFPSYEQESRSLLSVAEGVVSLEVTARDRYTTDMRLRYQGPTKIIWSNSNLDLRLYHDVRMSEVVNSACSSRFEARYNYPNPNMLQRDEKYQQNRFAADLMEFCLTNGCSLEVTLINPQNC